MTNATGRLLLGDRGELVLDVPAGAERVVDVDVYRVGPLIGRARVDREGLEVLELLTVGELEREQVPELVRQAELEYARREKCPHGARWTTCLQNHYPPREVQA